MELIDILDENGNPAGVIKNRKEVHENGLWHRVVHIWILNSKGELLLAQRAAGKKTYPGFWGISCEGHISAGQSSVEGALRELKEELGLDFSQDDLTLLFKLKNKTITNNGTYFGNHFIDLYLIERDLNETGLHLQEEEVSAIRWIKYQELEQIYLRNDPGYKHYKESPQFFDFLRAKINTGIK